MPSFTFSSNKRRVITLHFVKVLLVFAASLSFSAAAGELGSRLVPGLKVWRGDDDSVIPGESDIYLAYAAVEEIDHYVLYNGFGSALEHARQADVIILGNSRVLFAFDPEVVREVSRQTGIKFYSLGFGYGDMVTFPLEIIKKHDLRPPVVVVNADEFFGVAVSKVAQNVLDDGYWGGFKHVMETNIAWSVGRRLHRVIPRFNNLPELIIYRSSIDGSWLIPDGITPDRYPVSVPDSLELQAITVNKHLLEQFKATENYRLAAIFKKEMDKRGTKIVFTITPHDRADYTEAVKLSVLLDIPLVLSVPEGLETWDKSHLTKESAERYTRAFFKRFLELTFVSQLAF